MKQTILPKILAGESAVAVIGLGYTGLPLALALANHYRVIGYDKDPQTIASLASGTDPRSEIEVEQLRASSIQFTCDSALLSHACFFIITVPTPVDDQKNPDLTMLKQAMSLIAASLKQGDCVVLESTVYPGCTEEICVPLLEENSGLELNQDFLVGYSPERINPGDKQHRLDNVVKLIAGSNLQALELIQAVYAPVVPAGLHRCPSIKVAEAAKMTENIQRDVNIALLNELSEVYSQMGIDTGAVWEAASTKWNFLPFRPGLAGGHCISVDPYYLLYRAMLEGAVPSLVAKAREINEEMVDKVAEKVLTHVSERKENSTQASVLIMGISFKGNVSDLRNSKILELANKLREEGLLVDLSDPLVNSASLKDGFGWSLITDLKNNYDIIIIGADHAAYNKLGEDYFCAISGEQSLIFDLKGIFGGKISKRKYQSL